jgi:hypothetical protein
MGCHTWARPGWQARSASCVPWCSPTCLPAFFFGPFPWPRLSGSPQYCFSCVRRWWGDGRPDAPVVCGAVVQPHERVYASGVANLTRTGAWAVTASVSGVLMQPVAFSAPLVLGGAMKVSCYCTAVFGTSDLPKNKDQARFKPGFGRLKVSRPASRPSLATFRRKSEV